jgi:hypothetical protein
VRETLDGGTERVSSFAPRPIRFIRPHGRKTITVPLDLSSHGSGPFWWRVRSRGQGWMATTALSQSEAEELSVARGPAAMRYRRGPRPAHPTAD